MRTVSQPLFSLVAFPLFVSIDARKPELADILDFFLAPLLVLGGGSLDGPGTVSEGRGLFWRVGLPRDLERDPERDLEPDLDLDPGFLLPDLDAKLNICEYVRLFRTLLANLSKSAVVISGISAYPTRQAVIWVTFPQLTPKFS